jgi:divalent metal cation (Fe/Co/Zn/Cd) transporter
MDRANALVAAVSALVGGISLSVALTNEGVVSLAGVLGGVLLLNALVRLRLARRR